MGLRSMNCPLETNILVSFVLNILGRHLLISGTPVLLANLTVPGTSLQMWCSFCTGQIVLMGFLPDFCGPFIFRKAFDSLLHSTIWLWKELWTCNKMVQQRCWPGVGSPNNWEEEVSRKLMDNILCDPQKMLSPLETFLMYTKNWMNTQSWCSHGALTSGENKSTEMHSSC